VGSATPGACGRRILSLRSTSDTQRSEAFGVYLGGVLPAGFQAYLDADAGETGVFARLGWSDGRTESFVFTEVDRHASAVVQLSGIRWGRRSDVLGLGRDRGPATVFALRFNTRY